MGKLIDAANLEPHDPVDIKNAGIDGVLAYTGSGCPSREWLDAALAAGLEVAFIYEGSEDWALGGYNAGRTAAFQADGRLDSLGEPFHEAAVYYVANDGTADIGDTAEIRTECFRGIIDYTSRPVIGAYGSRAGLDAARAAGPRVGLFWGVSTWGQPDWNGYPLEIMQLANDASPIPGTDLDELFAVEWGQVPRITPPAPPAPTQEEADMIVLLCDGELPLLVAQTWCDEIDGAGTLPVGYVNKDQRTYIVNAIRAQYPPTPKPARGK